MKPHHHMIATTCKSQTTSLCTKKKDLSDDVHKKIKIFLKVFFLKKTNKMKILSMTSSSSSSILYRSITRLYSNNTPTLSTVLQVDNPYTNEIYCHLPLHTHQEAMDCVVKASQSQKEWIQQYPTLEERKGIVNEWMKCLLKNKESIAQDITGQMGKPLQQVRSSTVHTELYIYIYIDNLLFYLSTTVY